MWISRDASASKKPFTSDFKTPISGGLGKFTESASLEAMVAIGLNRDKLLHYYEQHCLELKGELKSLAGAPRAQIVAGFSSKASGENAATSATVGPSS